jgi:hypothetical protein
VTDEQDGHFGCHNKVPLLVSSANWTKLLRFFFPLFSTVHGRNRWAFFIANGANNANFSAEKTKFRVTPVLAGGARVRPHLRLAQVQVFAAFAMGLVR